jgi:outer membrane protein
MKTFLRQCFAGIFFGCLLVCAPVQAQEFRLGFVRIDRIFKEATSAKAAQTKLEQEFAQRDKDLLDQSALLKSMVEKFQIEATALSEVQRASRQKMLADQDRELQRKRRAFQEDLNTRQTEEWQQLLTSANTVVKQIAKAENFDLVLQDAVYVNPKHDITDKVISILNAQSTK